MNPTILLLLATATQQLEHPPFRPQRPRDPFVFRCVLDGRPRIVTLALSDEMWAAWDARTCSLYKVWKGGVLFDGAVYTTVHGPTPTSRGAEYVRGIEGDVWFARVGEQLSPARALWRGYRMEGEGCALLYDILLQDGRAVRVEERPEFVPAERMFPGEGQLDEWNLKAGLPGFARRFQALDVPAGVIVAVQVRSDAPRGRFIDAGGAAQERLIDHKDASGNVTSTEIHSLLWLDANRKANSITLFYDPLVLPPPEPPAEKGAKNGKKRDVAKEGAR